MTDTSTHLLLPYLLAAQAQMHVTVNEALRLPDGLVQLAVLDRHLTAPPASPDDGARDIVAPGATGAWSGWDSTSPTRSTAPGCGRSRGRAGRHGSSTRASSSPGTARLDSRRPAGLLLRRGVPARARSDPTRRAVFDLAAIAAGTVRSFALPDVSTELAGLSGAQTFDGDKTFAGELEASGPVATIGTAAGTATYGVGTGRDRCGRHQDRQPRHRRGGGFRHRRQHRLGHRPAPMARWWSTRQPSPSPTA